LSGDTSFAHRVIKVLSAGFHSPATANADWNKKHNIATNFKYLML